MDRPRRHPGPWRRTPDHPFYHEAGRKWHPRAGPWRGRGPMGARVYEAGTRPKGRPQPKRGVTRGKRPPRRTR